MEPDFFVDVTDVIERKVAMLSRHVSQKRWLDESQGHESYLQTLRSMDEEPGRMSGCSPMPKVGDGICIWASVVPRDDPLRAALKDRRVRLGQRKLLNHRERLSENPARWRPSAQNIT